MYGFVRSACMYKIELEAGLTISPGSGAAPLGQGFPKGQSPWLESHLLPKQPMTIQPKRNPNLVYYINNSSI